MAVVPYSSDVLCMHKTRFQLLYTDVQQLKMVQMVSQPLYFAIFIYLSGAIALLLKEIVQNFFQNFAQYGVIALNINTDRL